MKYKDRMRFASTISQAAKDWRAIGPKRFKGDEEMIKAYRSDANDLVRVAKLLRSGDVYQAAQQATGLDTIVREQVPYEAYEALYDFLKADAIADKNRSRAREFEIDCLEEMYA